jgi:hypothetical protein
MSIAPASDLWPRADFYTWGHPGAADVLLVIESRLTTKGSTHRSSHQWLTW